MCQPRRKKWLLSLSVISPIFKRESGEIKLVFPYIELEFGKDPSVRSLGTLS